MSDATRQNVHTGRYQVLELTDLIRPTGVHLDHCAVFCRLPPITSSTAHLVNIVHLKTYKIQNCGLWMSVTEVRIPPDSFNSLFGISIVTVTSSWQCHTAVMK